MKKKADLEREFFTKPYARILVPVGDGTYAAELLEFPGCFAQGDTPQDAIKNLEDAAAAWIEAARERDQEIPEPLATYGYSGKISLRIPRSVHKKAARFAQKDDVSLNSFFASAIAARVGAEDFLEGLLRKFKERIAAVLPTQPPQLADIPPGVSLACNVSIQNLMLRIQDPGPVITTATIGEPRRDRLASSQGAD
jgi:predicted RNase H-like HicB family nuclease